jgi:hypothetical protein
MLDLPTMENEKSAKGGSVISCEGNSSVRRVGLTFHESFAFVRSAVAAVLSVAGRKGSDCKLTIDLLREETCLGRSYAKAMPKYCQAAGLLDQNNELTTLGRRVHECDPHLEMSETLWFCHYKLADSKGPGPEFWHMLVSGHLLVGDELKTAILGDYLGKFSSDGGNPIAERTATTAASVFLKTYSRVDCLGGLGILEEQEAGTYLVKDAQPPPSLVFAYAISEYWQRNLSNQTSVWIDEFNKAGGVAQVLLMGRGKVNRAMRELSQVGIATVQLTQPPYQFSPLWKNQNELLDRIYGT